MNRFLESAFEKNSAEERECRFLFEKLGTTKSTPADIVNLRELWGHISRGRDSGFLSQFENVLHSYVPDVWERWEDLIAQIVEKYKDELEQLDSPIYGLSKGIGDRMLGYDFLKTTPAIPAEQSVAIQNFQNLKLIYLGILALPNERTRGLKIEEIPRIFSKSNLYMPRFSSLVLDFNRISLNEAAQAVSSLILNVHRERSDYRVFLTKLRDSLYLLQGDLPNPRSAKKHGSGSSSSTQKKYKTTKVRLKSYKSDLGGDLLGDGIEITKIDTGAGEDFLIGFETEDASDDLVLTNANVRIDEVRSKFWLQQYQQFTPWGRRGFNAPTQRLLVDWVKSTDSKISFLTALSICTGKRIDQVLDLTVGEEGNFDCGGIFKKTYVPPSKHYTPEPDISLILESNTNVFLLDLPAFIKERFTRYFAEDTKGSISIGDQLGINSEEAKQKISGSLSELVRNGATGLTMDRIPLVLNKCIAENFDDPFLAYLIVGDEKDEPPISSFYSSYSSKDLKKMYDILMESLFSE